MTLILTSFLDMSSKNELNERIPHNFGNKNGILDNIKKFSPKCENLVFIASNEYDYDVTDIYAKVTFDSFKLTFPFNNYIILDGRTKDKAKKIIENADLIFLCGGHVPTQNQFFKNINLKEIIKITNALIIGVSAGSMNSAEIVYAQPELEGETLDENYKKYLKGLELTKISILPHFMEGEVQELDNKNILQEISLPDSLIRPFIAFPDGTYIIDTGEKQTIYGESYLFRNGKYNKLTENNSITDITALVSEIFVYNPILIKE